MERVAVRNKIIWICALFESGYLLPYNFYKRRIDPIISTHDRNAYVTHVKLTRNATLIPVSTWLFVVIISLNLASLVIGLLISVQNMSDAVVIRLFVGSINTTLTTTSRIKLCQAIPVNIKAPPATRNMHNISANSPITWRKEFLHFLTLTVTSLR